MASPATFAVSAGRHGWTPPFGQVAESTDESLVVRHTLDPRTHDWLAHHSVGRQVATRDPGLYGLSVVPMAVSLELMAQAARGLSPDHVVGHISHIRAGRWLAFDNEERTIEVHARLDQERRAVVAQIRIQGEHGDVLPAVEATVGLTAEFPVADAPVLAPASSPSTLDPTRYYEEALFHDATWRVLKQRVRIDKRRASAQLDSRMAKFAGWDVRSLCMDPVLFDGVGQLLGLWSAQVLSEGVFHFPIGIREIAVFGSPPADDQDVHVALEIIAVNHEDLIADAELSVGGRLYARIIGLRSRRFYIPKQLRPVTMLNDAGSICRNVALSDLGLAGTASVAVSLDISGLHDDGFVSRVWAARILTRQERRRFSQAQPEPGQVLQWLARSHAQKESARQLLAERQGIDVRLADIEIIGHGRGARATAANDESVAAGDASDWPQLYVWGAAVGDRVAAVASLRSDLVDVGPALDRLVTSFPSPSAESDLGAKHALPAAAAGRPHPEDVLERLREAIERLSGDWEIDHPITPEARLIGDLGMKSIDLVVIASAMVKTYGLIPFDELYAQMASIPAEGRDLSIAQFIEFVCDRAPHGAAAVNAED